MLFYSDSKLIDSYEVDANISKFTIVNFTNVLITPKQKILF